MNEKDRDALIVIAVLLALFLFVGWWFGWGKVLLVVAIVGLAALVMKFAK